MSLIISSPFKRERTSMLITLLIQKGKKYRKLAKGELNIYKKYLFNQNLNFEKWIYLSTYSNQLNIPPNSNENNVYPGKIFIKGQFLDSESFNNKINNEDLKNYLTPNNIILNTKLLKGAISSIPKKERESSTGANKHKKVNASLQEGLNKLGTNSLSVKLDEEDEERLVAMKENEYDDDLSDVSLSIIDEDEDDKLNEVDSVNLQVDSMITKLRKYFDENSDSVLPNDHDKLRNLLENLTSQVKSISETYSQNLQSMSSINKRLKFQAKDYYERYKELKTVFEKERKEFQAKNKLIKFEEKINTEENMKIGKEIADIKNEIDFFQKKLGIPQEKKDEETEIMVDILKSLKEKGVDIYEGLSKEQIEFI
ncbi:MAG: RNA polymerase I-specific transcription initiation factor RRN3 family protein, partial [archaeon]|nr:RNA polymerase I-specific transcription initiation factor RRN3 family protein [archaeon]